MLTAKILLGVSEPAAVSPVDESNGPRNDHGILARELGAAVLDPSSIVRSAGARWVARLLRSSATLAWLAFRRRGEYDVIVTDSEQIGIPLALLLKLADSSVAHVTIGHRITAATARPFFRRLGVHSHIARIALHSRRQYDLAIAELGIPADRLALVPQRVDTEFWRPLLDAEERLICSAGLERRDYATLFRAVEGLDARIVIGASDHRSRRSNAADGLARPANVVVDSVDQRALRALYARAAIVVVPLDETDVQAGVTTILEAMAMGRAVVVTHSEGQTDVVQDRRAVTRSACPRSRPTSLLRTVAEQSEVDLEPTGFYVPPGDPDALRRALVYLLDHPVERTRLGLAGRRAVERLMTVDQFAARMRVLVDGVRPATAVAPALGLVGLGAGIGNS